MGLLSTIAFGTILAVLTIYLFVRTILLCRRFNAWLLWGTLALDLLVFLLPIALWLLGALLEALGVVSEEVLDQWFQSWGSGAIGATSILYFAWKLWLLSALTRWEPSRGLFAAPPRWPRAQAMRGSRRPRRRAIPEPTPWVRGPGSW